MECDTTQENIEWIRAGDIAAKWNSAEQFEYDTRIQIQIWKHSKYDHPNK